MKILHINCNYVGTSLHRIMIDHLSDRGIENVVFCPVANQSINEMFSAKSNEHISVCFDNRDRLLYFKKQKKIREALQKTINIHEYDIIHAYTLMTDGNIARSFLKKYGIPYVVAVRSTDVKVFFRLKPYLRPLAVQIMRDAKAVFFLSDSYRVDVLQRIIPKKYRSELESKMHIIPNGIDSLWLNNRFLDRDYDNALQRFIHKDLKVICVGKINKSKNIPTLQAALSILRDQGWEISLKVIGKTEDEIELNKIKKDRYTEYMQPMDQDELIKHYRAADIFVLVSHRETFGLVYAEAMSQSLPVIYTRGQGFDRQFSEGEVGFSVNDDDPIEIADKIVRICKDYKRLAKNAVERCVRFDWDEICKKYCLIYQQTLCGE